jgi:guanylate kinase
MNEELATLIATYQPSDTAKELVCETKITLLVGISGAGKDTIKKELLKKPDFRDIVSHTTRAPRSNNGIVETPEVDYHFIDESTARTMLKGQEFIEAKFVHGTVYGTSVGELQQSYDQQKIAITDVDVQGVAEYKELSQHVVAIFVIPPSYSIWRERLSQRYETAEDFEAEWIKRRNSAVSELTHALEVPYYHFIINDELDRAVTVADEIAHKPDVFHRKDDEARLRARDLLTAIQTSL